MVYGSVRKAEFLLRQNRFIAKVLLDGKEEDVHVKNTGRCREILLPGSTVYLAEADMTGSRRKTRFDLVAVEKPMPDGETVLVNIDSVLPNEAAAAWLPKSGLFSPQAHIRREVTYGSSRFDLYIEDGTRRAFMEVKGVTQEEAGIALFPDAPTERGIRHLHELIEARKAGYETYLLFVIAMKGVRVLHPNRRIHPAFADALREAAAHGVVILARDCRVTPCGITVDKEIPVELS